jgi:hypothetical protein
MHTPVPKPPALEPFAEASVALIGAGRIVKRRRHAVFECRQLVLLWVTTVGEALGISTVQLLTWHASHAARRQLRPCVVETPPTTVAAMEPIEAVEVLKYVRVLLGSVLSLKILIHAWHVVLEVLVVACGRWIALHGHLLAAELNSFLRRHHFLHCFLLSVVAIHIIVSTEGFKALALFALVHAVDGAFECTSPVLATHRE